MSGKRCSKCGEMKGVEAFSRNKSKKDGLQSRCKTCVRRHYEENREARREYLRRYREGNREAILERQRRHYEENREAVLESQRRYYEENREAIIESRRRYQEENREAVAESKRRYYEENRDMTRESATRTWERYTPAEDAHILTSGEPIAVIAVELGRTMTSIAHRRRILLKAVTA